MHFTGDEAHRTATAKKESLEHYLKNVLPQDVANQIQGEIDDYSQLTSKLRMRAVDGFEGINELWLAEERLEWKLKDLRSTIKKTTGRALMIITAGALSTLYLLHLAQKQTQEAQDQMDEVSSHLDDLTVILGPSSPLFTPHGAGGSLEVRSLKKTLPLLASWLNTPKEDTPTISQWCLPKVSEDLGVEASCQTAS